MTPGLVVPQLLASDDPLAELLRGVEKVKEIGTENLDGIPVILVELTKSVLTLGPTLPAGTGDFPVTARLWIGAQDHLIHQVSYSPVEANIKGEEATVRHTNIEVTPAHPKAFFTFALPAGAHLVKQFALPYDVELAKEHHAAE